MSEKRTLMQIYCAKEMELYYFGFALLTSMNHSGYPKEQLETIPNMTIIGDIGCHLGKITEEIEAKMKRALFVKHIVDTFQTLEDCQAYCDAYKDDYPVVILWLYEQFKQSKQQQLNKDWIIYLCEQYFVINPTSHHVRVIYCNVLNQAQRYKELQTEATIGLNIAQETGYEYFIRIFQETLHQNQIFMEALEGNLGNLSGYSVKKLLKVAKFCFAEKRFRNAATCFEKVREREGLRKYDLRTLYYCYESLHDYEKAIKIYDELLDRKDLAPQDRENIMPRKKRAKHYLETSKNQEPDIPEGQVSDWRDSYNIAEGYYAKERYDVALSYYLNIFETVKDFGPLYFRIASCYRRLERYEDELALLESSEGVPCLQNYEGKRIGKITFCRRMIKVKNGDLVYLHPINDSNVLLYITIVNCYMKHGHFLWELYYMNDLVRYYENKGNIEQRDKWKVTMANYKVKVLEQIGMITITTGTKEELEQIVKPYRKFPDLYRAVLEKLKEECKRKNQVFPLVLE